MHQFIQAVVLGIVEGVTEFLPISSTGHLIIVNRFINFSGEFADMFDVVIQLGAILSVIVYFWNRLYPFSSSKTAEQKTAVWNIWKKTLVGVLPALAIGGTLGHKVEELLFNPVVVAGALLIGGIIIIAIEARKKQSTIDSLEHLSYKLALGIGFIQCCAMVPGTSRAAATIIGAMVLGASRAVAAEFSFFLAIPTMAAASGYSLLKHGVHLTVTEWEVLFIGFAVSFFVAWGVIAFFMNYIRRNTFTLFAYYRIVLAIIIFILIYCKVLSPS